MNSRPWSVMTRHLQGDSLMCKYLKREGWSPWHLWATCPSRAKAEQAVTRLIGDWNRIPTIERDNCQAIILAPGIDRKLYTEGKW